MTVKTRITVYIAGAGFVASLLFSGVVFFELIEQPFQLLDTVLKEEAYRTVAKYQGGSDSVPVHSDFVAMDRYWIEVYEQGTNKILFQSGLAKSVKLPPVRPGSRAIARPTLLF